MTERLNPSSDARADFPQHEDRPPIANLVLDYIKVLVWPSIIVGILIVYQPPLGRMFQSLAVKLEAADSVKFGSFELEVLKTARDLGSPELATQIGELSFNAIEALVRTPRTGSMILLSTNDRTSPVEFGLPSEADLEGLRELEEKGLITFDVPLKAFLAELKSLGRKVANDVKARAPDRQWYAFNDISEEQKQRFRSEGYSLTEDGKKAVEAISKAVAAQLSKQR
jgi:hypothetical protein